MAVVRINSIEVPEGMGAELESRFAQRARAVDSVPGFEGFELLRPTDGRTTYFVYTRWTSEEHFEDWVNSDAFQRGHAGEQANGPVGSASELLSFDVVISATSDAG